VKNYNEQGDFTSGEKVTTVYDEWGKVLEQTIEKFSDEALTISKGKEVKGGFKYDDNGNLIAYYVKTYNASGVLTTSQKITYKYNDENQLIEQRIETYEDEAQLNMISSEITNNFKYDSRGNVIYYIRTTYDADGNMKDRQEVKLEYDSKDRISYQFTKTFKLDSTGNEILVSVSIRKNIKYDRKDRIISQTVITIGDGSIPLPTHFWSGSQLYGQDGEWIEIDYENIGTQKYYKEGDGYLSTGSWQILDYDYFDHYYIDEETYTYNANGSINKHTSRSGKDDVHGKINPGDWEIDDEIPESAIDDDGNIIYDAYTNEPIEFTRIENIRMENGTNYTKTTIRSNAVTVTINGRTYAVSYDEEITVEGCVWNSNTGSFDIVNSNNSGTYTREFDAFGNCTYEHSTNTFVDAYGVTVTHITEIWNEYDRNGNLIKSTTESTGPGPRAYIDPELWILYGSDTDIGRALRAAFDEAGNGREGGYWEGKTLVDWAKANYAAYNLKQYGPHGDIVTSRTEKTDFSKGGYIWGSIPGMYGVEMGFVWVEHCYNYIETNYTLGPDGKILAWSRTEVTNELRNSRNWVISRDTKTSGVDITGNSFDATSSEKMTYNALGWLMHKTEIRNDGDCSKGSGNTHINTYYTYDKQGNISQTKVVTTVANGCGSNVYTDTCIYDANGGLIARGTYKYDAEGSFWNSTIGSIVKIVIKAIIAIVAVVLCAPTGGGSMGLAAMAMAALIIATASTLVDIMIQYKTYGTVDWGSAALGFVISYVTSFLSIAVTAPLSACAESALGESVIGQTLLSVREAVNFVMDAIKGWLSQAVNAVTSFFKETMWGGLKEMWNFVTEVIGGFFDNMFSPTVIPSGSGGFIEAIKTVASQIVKIFGEIKTWITNLYKKITDVIKTWITDLYKKITDIIYSVVSKLSMPNTSAVMADAQTEFMKEIINSQVRSAVFQIVHEAFSEDIYDFYRSIGLSDTWANALAKISISFISTVLTGSWEDPWKEAPATIGSSSLVKFAQLISLDFAGLIGATGIVSFAFNSLKDFLWDKIKQALDVVVWDDAQGKWVSNDERNGWSWQSWLVGLLPEFGDWAVKTEQVYRMIDAVNTLEQHGIKIDGSLKMHNWIKGIMQGTYVLEERYIENDNSYGLCLVDVNMQEAIESMDIKTESGFDVKIQASYAKDDTGLYVSNGVTFVAYDKFGNIVLEAFNPSQIDTKLAARLMDLIGGAINVTKDGITLRYELMENRQAGQSGYIFLSELTEQEMDVKFNSIDISLSGEQGVFFQTIFGDIIFRSFEQNEYQNAQPVSLGEASVAFIGDVLIRDGYVVSAKGIVVEGKMQVAREAFEIKAGDNKVSAEDKITDNSVLSGFTMMYLTLEENDMISMGKGSEFMMENGNIILNPDSIITVSGNSDISIGNVVLKAGGTYLIDEKGKAVSVRIEGDYVYMPTELKSAEGLTVEKMVNIHNKADVAYVAVSINPDTNERSYKEGRLYSAGKVIEDAFGDGPYLEGMQDQIFLLPGESAKVQIGDTEVTVTNIANDKPLQAQYHDEKGVLITGTIDQITGMIIAKSSISKDNIREAVNNVFDGLEDSALSRELKAALQGAVSSIIEELVDNKRIGDVEEAEKYAAEILAGFMESDVPDDAKQAGALYSAVKDFVAASLLFNAADMDSVKEYTKACINAIMASPAAEFAAEGDLVGIISDVMSSLTSKIADGEIKNADQAVAEINRILTPVPFDEQENVSLTVSSQKDESGIDNVLAKLDKENTVSDNTPDAIKSYNKLMLVEFVKKFFGESVAITDEKTAEFFKNFAINDIVNNPDEYLYIAKNGNIYLEIAADREKGIGTMGEAKIIGLYLSMDGDIRMIVDGAGQALPDADTAGNAGQAETISNYTVNSDGSITGVVEYSVRMDESGRLRAESMALNAGYTAYDTDGKSLTYIKVLGRFEKTDELNDSSKAIDIAREIAIKVGLDIDYENFYIAMITEGDEVKYEFMLKESFEISEDVKAYKAGDDEYDGFTDVKGDKVVFDPKTGEFSLIATACLKDGQWYEVTAGGVSEGINLFSELEKQEGMKQYLKITADGRSFVSGYMGMIIQLAMGADGKLAVMTDEKGTALAQVSPYIANYRFDKTIISAGVKLEWSDAKGRVYDVRADRDYEMDADGNTNMVLQFSQGSEHCTLNISKLAIGEGNKVLIKEGMLTQAKLSGGIKPDGTDKNVNPAQKVIKGTNVTITQEGGEYYRTGTILIIDGQEYYGAGSVINYNLANEVEAFGRLVKIATFNITLKGAELDTNKPYDVRVAIKLINSEGKEITFYKHIVKKAGDKVEAITFDIESKYVGQTFTVSQGDIAMMTYKVVKEDDTIMLQLIKQEFTVSTLAKGTLLTWADEKGKSFSMKTDKPYQISSDGSVDISLQYEKGADRFDLTISKLSLNEDNKFIIASGKMKNVYLEGMIDLKGEGSDISVPREIKGTDVTITQKDGKYYTTGTILIVDGREYYGAGSVINYDIDTEVEAFGMLVKTAVFNVTLEGVVLDQTKAYDIRQKYELSKDGKTVYAYKHITRDEDGNEQVKFDFKDEHFGATFAIASDTITLDQSGSKNTLEIPGLSKMNVRVEIVKSETSPDGFAFKIVKQDLDRLNNKTVILNGKQGTLNVKDGILYADFKAPGVTLKLTLPDATAKQAAPDDNKQAGEKVCPDTVFGIIERIGNEVTIGALNTAELSKEESIKYSDKNGLLRFTIDLALGQIGLFGQGMIMSLSAGQEVTFGGITFRNEDATNAHVVAWDTPNPQESSTDSAVDILVDIIKTDPVDGESFVVRIGRDKDSGKTQPVIEKGFIYNNYDFVSLDKADITKNETYKAQLAGRVFDVTLTTDKRIMLETKEIKAADNFKVDINGKTVDFTPKESIALELKGHRFVLSENISGESAGSLLMAGITEISISDQSLSIKAGACVLKAEGKDTVFIIMNNKAVSQALAQKDAQLLYDAVGSLSEAVLQYDAKTDRMFVAVTRQGMTEYIEKSSLCKESKAALDALVHLNDSLTAGDLMILHAVEVSRIDIEDESNLFQKEFMLVPIVSEKDVHSLFMFAYLMAVKAVISGNMTKEAIDAFALDLTQRGILDPEKGMSDMDSNQVDNLARYMAELISGSGDFSKDMTMFAEYIGSQFNDNISTRIKELSAQKLNYEGILRMAETTPVASAGKMADDLKQKINKLDEEIALLSETLKQGINNFIADIKDAVVSFDMQFNIERDPKAGPQAEKDHLNVSININSDSMKVLSAFALMTKGHILKESGTAFENKEYRLSVNITKPGISLAVLGLGISDIEASQANTALARAISEAMVNLSGVTPGAAEYQEMVEANTARLSGMDTQQLIKEAEKNHMNIELSASKVIYTSSEGLKDEVSIQINIELGDGIVMDNMVLNITVGSKGLISGPQIKGHTFIVNGELKSVSMTIMDSKGKEEYVAAVRDIDGTFKVISAQDNAVIDYDEESSTLYVSFDKQYMLQFGDTHDTIHEMVSVDLTTGQQSVIDYSSKNMLSSYRLGQTIAWATYNSINAIASWFGAELTYLSRDNVYTVADQKVLSGITYGHATIAASIVVDILMLAVGGFAFKCIKWVLNAVTFSALKAAQVFRAGTVLKYLGIDAVKFEGSVISEAFKLFSTRSGLGNFISKTASEKIAKAASFKSKILPYAADYAGKVISNAPGAIWNLTYTMSVMLDLSGKLAIPIMSALGITEETIANMQPGVLKAIAMTVYHMGQGSVLNLLAENLNFDRMLFTLVFTLAMPAIHALGLRFSNFMSNKIGTRLSSLSAKNSRYLDSRIMRTANRLGYDIALKGAITLPALAKGIVTEGIFGASLHAIRAFVTLLMIQAPRALGSALWNIAKKFYSFVSGKLDYLVKSERFGFVNKITRGLSRLTGTVYEEGVKEIILARMFLSWLPDGIQEFMVEFSDILDGRPSVHGISNQALSLNNMSNQLIAICDALSSDNITKDTITDLVSEMKGKTFDKAGGGLVFDNNMSIPALVGIIKTVMTQIAEIAHSVNTENANTMQKAQILGAMANVIKAAVKIQESAPALKSKLSAQTADIRSIRANAARAIEFADSIITNTLLDFKSVELEDTGDAIVFLQNVFFVASSVDFVNAMQDIKAQSSVLSRQANASVAVSLENVIQQAVEVMNKLAKFETNLKSAGQDSNQIIQALALKTGGMQTLIAIKQVVQALETNKYKLNNMVSNKAMEDVGTIGSLFNKSVLKDMAIPEAMKEISTIEQLKQAKAYIDEKMADLSVRFSNALREPGNNLQSPEIHQIFDKYADLIAKNSGYALGILLDMVQTASQAGADINMLTQSFADTCKTKSGVRNALINMLHNAMAHTQSGQDELDYIIEGLRGDTGKQDAIVNTRQFYKVFNNNFVKQLLRKLEVTRALSKEDEQGVINNADTMLTSFKGDVTLIALLKKADVIHKGNVNEIKELKDKMKKAHDRINEKQNELQKTEKDLQKAKKVKNKIKIQELNNAITSLKTELEGLTTELDSLNSEYKILVDKAGNALVQFVDKAKQIAVEKGMLELAPDKKAADEKQAFAFGLAIADLLANIESGDMNNTSRKGLTKKQRNFMMSLFEGKFGALSMAGGKTYAFAAEMCVESLIQGGNLAGMIMLESPEAVVKYMNPLSDTDTGNEKGLQHSQYSLLKAFGLEMVNADMLIEKFRTAADPDAKQSAYNELVNAFDANDKIVIISREARGHLQNTIAHAENDKLYNAVAKTNTLRIDEFDSVLKVRDTFIEGGVNDKEVSREKVESIEKIFNIFLNLEFEKKDSANNPVKVAIDDLTGDIETYKQKRTTGLAVCYDSRFDSVYMSTELQNELLKQNINLSEAESVIRAMNHRISHDYLVTHDGDIVPVGAGRAKYSSVFQDMGYRLAIALKHNAYIKYDKAGETKAPKGLEKNIDEMSALHKGIYNDEIHTESLTYDSTNMQSTLREIFGLNSRAHISGGSGTFNEVLAILPTVTGIEIDSRRSSVASFTTDHEGNSVTWTSMDLSNPQANLSETITDGNKEMKRDRDNELEDAKTNNRKANRILPKHILGICKDNQDMANNLVDGAIASMLTQGAAIIYALDEPMRIMVRDMLIERIQKNKDLQSKLRENIAGKLEKLGLEADAERIRSLNADALADYIIGNDGDSIIASNEHGREINDIARDAQKGHIVFINDAGLVGLNYTGDVDIHIAASNLSEDLLLQGIYRVQRGENDIATRVVYVNSQSVKENLEYLVKNYNQLKAIIAPSHLTGRQGGKELTPEEKTNIYAMFDQAKKLLDDFAISKDAADGKDLDQFMQENEQNACQLMFKVSGAIQMSRSNVFIVSDIASGYLIEAVKDLLRKYSPADESQPQPEEAKVLEKHFLRLLDKQSASRTAALDMLDTPMDAEAIISQIFDSNASIAIDFLKDLINDMSKVHTTKALEISQRYLEPLMKEYESVLLNTAETSTYVDNFKDSTSYSQLYDVAKRGFIDYVLPSFSGDVSGSYRQTVTASTERVAKTRHDDTSGDVSLKVDEVQGAIESAVNEEAKRLNEVKGNDAGTQAKGSINIQQEAQRILEFAKENYMIDADNNLTPRGMMALEAGIQLALLKMALPPDEWTKIVTMCAGIKHVNSNSLIAADIALMIMSIIGAGSSMKDFDANGLLQIAREYNALNGKFKDDGFDMTNAQLKKVFSNTDNLFFARKEFAKALVSSCGSAGFKEKHKQEISYFRHLQNKSELDELKERAGILRYRISQEKTPSKKKELTRSLRRIAWDIWLKENRLARLFKASENKIDEAVLSLAGGNEILNIALMSAGFDDYAHGIDKAREIVEVEYKTAGINPLYKMAEAELKVNRRIKAAEKKQKKWLYGSKAFRITKDIEKLSSKLNELEKDAETNKKAINELQTKITVLNNRLEELYDSALSSDNELKSALDDYVSAYGDLKGLDFNTADNELNNLNDITNSTKELLKKLYRDISLGKVHDQNAYIHKFLRHNTGISELPASLLKIYQDFAATASDTVLLKRDNQGKFVIEGNAGARKDMKDLVDVLNAGIQSIDKIQNMLKDTQSGNNVDLHGLFEKIIASTKEGSPDGIVIQMVKKTQGGSIAEKAQEQKVTMGSDGKPRATIALSYDFIKFAKAAIAQDTSEGKIASGWLVLEQLLHEMAHSDKVIRWTKDILPRDLADEIKNKIMIDGAMTMILYGNDQMLHEVDLLREKTVHSMGGAKGHYAYRLSTFTKIDDNGNRICMSEDEIVNEVVRQSIEQFEDQAASSAGVPADYRQALKDLADNAANIAGSINSHMQQISQSAASMRGYVENEIFSIINSRLPLRIKHRKAVMGIKNVLLKYGILDQTLQNDPVSVEESYEVFKQAFEKPVMIAEKEARANNNGQDVSDQEIISVLKDKLNINNAGTDKIDTRAGTVLDAARAIRNAYDRELSKLENAGSIPSDNRSASSGIRPETERLQKDAVLKPGVLGAMYLKPGMEGIPETELTQDTAETAVIFINSIKAKPGNLTVTTGQKLIFASHTVTKSLAKSLDASFAIMTQSSKENISISIHGTQEKDALDALVKTAGTHNITVLTSDADSTETSHASIVCYDLEEAKAIGQSEGARHTRIVHIEQPEALSDNRVIAAMVILAIFNKQYKEMAREMTARGVDIGLSESEMDALFASADNAGGIIRIKPVDNERIMRITNTVRSQA